MATRIKAGKMRQRMQVIEWTVDQTNNYNEEDRTDETLRSFQAQLIPISSKEVMNAGQEQAFATHRMICRHNLAKPLKSVHKLKYNGREFEIISLINVDELNHKCICLLKEAVE